MADPRVTALAHILIDYSLAVQPGQFVVLDGAPEGAPLILAAYRRVLEAGGHPHQRLSLDAAREVFFRVASDPQLEYVSDIDREFVERTDATLMIWTETNTKALTGVDPVKQTRVQSARRALNERFAERAAAKELSWCVTLYPTQAFAQDAEMSLAEFEDFVYNAALIDEPEPVAAWQDLGQEHQRLIDWLSPRREVRLVGPDTDLTLSIEGRGWENCDGRRNFPDGEIFTGPIENSANGRVRFSYPACMNGREVEDVRLWFEEGKVVKATAAKNEAFLHAMLDTDEGARRLGEFAFGTNPGIQRFTKNILFDEKIGGTVHMALGRGYPDVGSQNKSAIHWDMICDLRDGGEVWVDGVLFAKDGEFNI
jgi:aminopeptidase